MNLVMFLQMTGRGWAWRSPKSRIEDLWTLDLPLYMTKEAEKAKFDAIILGSWLGVETGSGPLGQCPFTGAYEPFTLIGALAARTENIGLVATASTTFEHPYNTARFLTMLDWLSRGRVGWNVVTSTSGEQHYGIELPPKEERYSRAKEYMEICKGLWDAWDEDAVVNDRTGGFWARPDRIHPIDYKGRYYEAQGQLFMHRSPQGRPVIVQAGQSREGRDFASRHAEVVFTAQTDIGAAQAFRRDLRDRAAAAGRNPDSIKVLPGLNPIVAETAEQARAFEAQLNEWTPLNLGIERVQRIFQAELQDLDPDQPIPAERLVSPHEASFENTMAQRDPARVSRYRNFYDMAVKDKMTLREMIGRTDRDNGHCAPIGSVSQIADLMQEWYESEACDGFVVSGAPAVPEALDTICQLLIPELQRRGLARTEYEGTTLRDHLGLERPRTPARPSKAGSVVS
ncbi:NtaA/DmoA family FMN-dependent monooxygenase [Bradyrhizobium sp. CW7]|uniref:NtaA/DmoA family FMN-dependent monooxygenase n=1 Tax=Bradyrhizobium sp. CW7 TaxID=2782688 RepID=UPI001FF82DC4|nr:NtaA/DmoA family FMN-dependent monooxygenase [Bradyrhizobium sp. CW7]MCK1352708.1 NtaA/DmoA family FMN-dependent monooxygenase [Bradyrhizobium sp. CW7]